MSRRHGIARSLEREEKAIDMHPSRSLNVPTKALLAAACVMLSQPALAQQDEPDEDKPDLKVLVGIGIQLRPSFPGASELSLRPLPLVRVRREGALLPSRAPDQNSSIKIVGDREGLSLGGTFNFQSKRDEDDVGAKVGDVGFTFEPGAYAQAFVTDTVRLRAEVRHGLGGHNAFVGDIAADYVFRPADDRFVATIGPRMRFADSRYHRRYFGITPETAAATGLPGFDADAGLYAVGATAGLLYQFTPQWGGFGYAGYDRLTGDAAHSPIVREFGSRNQFSTGLAVTYTFGVKR